MYEDPPPRRKLFLAKEQSFLRCVAPEVKSWFAKGGGALAGEGVLAHSRPPAPAQGLSRLPPVRRGVPGGPEPGSAPGDASSMMALEKGTRTPPRAAAAEALPEENDNCLFIYFDSIAKH